MSSHNYSRIAQKKRTLISIVVPTSVVNIERLPNQVKKEKPKKT